MLDFSISSGQLMLIWSFAGAVCCLPFFTKNIWQRFFTVPIIFIAIWLSFYTNHEFIGRPEGTISGIQKNYGKTHLPRWPLLSNLDKGEINTYECENPYYKLRDIIPQNVISKKYAGGLVGFVSYDGFNYFENNLNIKDIIGIDPEKAMPLPISIP